MPTTHILATGTLTAPLTADEMQDLLPREVKATVAIYLDGKIDQWWAKQDGTGVVFLLNVTSVEEAHEMLEKLPLGVAKRMTFELMPLGPLRPPGDDAEIRRGGVSGDLVVGRGEGGEGETAGVTATRARRLAA